MPTLSETDLILNPDGSIYHLNLLPGDLATTIITVGDPDRVEQISHYFDRVELKKQKREFVTHTGYINKQRISVISTGISTDNIDIVFNEIDALFNIDFKTRQVKDTITSLNFIRIGTAGALQADVPLDEAILTKYAIGFDGLLPFYEKLESLEEEALLKAAQYDFSHYIPAQYYVAAASPSLFNIFEKQFRSGITATCGGFYAPQGRLLRALTSKPQLIEKLNQFHFRDFRLTNFEMETAGIYGLGRVLGHHCCSLSVIVANRITQQFSRDPQRAITRLIEQVLERVALLQ
ncbi:MAG: phosphorylase [Gammaproteobacteria bacterium RIFCSPLOWO2_02_FULL_38_11]|nr:MAG: phosphorylase [Gammaproteobacteria bacterium RIFCSPLOWO2_02_FULL_38_11]